MAPMLFKPGLNKLHLTLFFFFFLLHVLMYFFDFRAVRIWYCAIYFMTNFLQVQNFMRAPYILFNVQRYKHH